jgi:hypothetical protein
MIIVKLQGGLGNQMFQYAVGKSLAHHYNTSFKLDHHFLESRHETANHIFRNYDLDIFALEAERATVKEVTAFRRKAGLLTKVAAYMSFVDLPEVVIEKHYHFDASLFKRSSYLYLDGYWQTESYFRKITKTIRNDFRFKRHLNTNSAELLRQFANDELVCVNVRRSDFLQNSFHPVCGLDYFIPAMELVASKLANPHFLVFSDDIDWCRQSFTSTHPLTIVDHTHKGQKFDNYLQLMSCCKHFIIPNSSFAWWAVWLANRKDNIVIAPQTWFNDPGWDTKDLLPNNWIMLSNT